MDIKKGDLVLVISGKDKGKRGKVISVLPSEEKVIVEGVNIVKKHTRPNAKMRQGGIIEKPAPLYRCKVMLICPHCNQPTRIKHTFLEDGRKVRVCSKCKEIIDRV
ncbi:50S ribosomal protein L24 [Dictyoglomus thermophilum]|uniref:Large ribosomal subunit protein uL24 n=2 Tax=Dictyoglomus thermophilum TaxID=14 RepID=RL24_DICT6|nr:50S ribosomal protein L24 [Dictyoglomus thermophilum]B5YDV4.1 RecName: Full=Large ribosomal subunit protein uL24; AltName: Full=50S ribosomal protein L24 [Dictyoglomus thermophilum H-6-12]ACI18715.1 ribosomal protein L24 [Dictyoglomus thermophilum H-6-12]MCX7721389.1 50S ribosomal protein L24 [Dictyoglomus thermophilum]TYT20999.1 50S ribosomal protein L24 [Dictyoglomus thermophilum]